MGTVQSSTVVIVSGSISTNSKLEQKWLTLGITAQSSSSGTCTTLTETVPWTNLILNAWPSATPSSRARVTGMRLLSKRTKRSWLTCGTKLLSWLTSTRTARLTEKNSLMQSKKIVRTNPSLNCPQHLKHSFTKLSNLARYQELYAQFIGNPDEKCPAVNLFGPLRSSTKRAVSQPVAMKKINMKKTKNNYLYHRG